jgi:hypothetical protein
MRYVTAILTLLWVSLVTTGCTRAIVESDNPVPVTTDGYRQTFEASVDVLRENGFTIDRRDYRFGKITTLPLGSPNMFEVWNSQNTTHQQAVESTLASEQRRVNVSISATADRSDQTDTPGVYMLEVEVILDRKQIPTRRLAGSARRNVFSNLAAPPKDLIDRGVTGSYWEAVGRDPYLEARLIKQITDQAGSAQ